MGMSTEKLPRRDKGFENRGPLEIHIEKFVLHGFPNINHKQFQSVVEGELARLFDQRNQTMAWDKFDKISQVDAGLFEIRNNQGLESAGFSVAQAVYRSLI